VKVLLALAARTGAARRRARLVGAWPNDEAVQALCIAESCGTLPASRQLYKVLQARDAVRCDASAEPAAYGSGLTPSEASAA
jgi:hypothetical protein